MRKITLILTFVLLALLNSCSFTASEYEVKETVTEVAIEKEALIFENDTIKNIQIKDNEGKKELEKLKKDNEIQQHNVLVQIKTLEKQQIILDSLLRQKDSLK